MARIRPDSEAGQFLVGQGVTEAELNTATFRVLNWQAGDALTVVWPFGGATIFIKSSFLRPDSDGDLPVDRKLPLIRHELFHVKQGIDWGFIKYWTKHLWARVRHLSISAKSSSVEAPAYELQRTADTALDQLGL